jgi:penicillin-binding protein 1A
VAEETAKEAKSILETVVCCGTGTNAQIGVPGQWGKTGTTSGSSDAWFCGSALEVTACVWVGYADSVTSMETLYNGGPVMGGTFPALIWARVVSAWQKIKAEIAAEKASHSHHHGSSAGSEEEIYEPPVGSTEVPETEAVEPAPEEEAAPETEAPAEAAPPAEAPAAPESTGAGGGVTAG